MFALLRYCLCVCTDCTPSWCWMGLVGIPRPVPWGGGLLAIWILGPDCESLCGTQKTPLTMHPALAPQFCCRDRFANALCR